MINLLNCHTPNEDILTQNMKKIFHDTLDSLSNKDISFSYEHFDFLAQCKKGVYTPLD
jgi:hypothetical protein